MRCYFFCPSQKNLQKYLHIYKCIFNIAVLKFYYGPLRLYL